MPRTQIQNDIALYHALSPIAAAFTLTSGVACATGTIASANIELLFPAIFCAHMYYAAARQARVGYEKVKQDIRHKGLDTVVRDDHARHPAMIYAQSSRRLHEYNRAVEACDYWRTYTSHR